MGLAGLFGGCHGWSIARRSSLDRGRGEAAHRAARLGDEGTGGCAPAKTITWRCLRADQRVEESVRAGNIATNRAVGILSRQCVEPKRQDLPLKKQPSTFALG
jgi:hypothetical protein